MHISQSSDIVYMHVRHIRLMMSALPLASARLSKLWIPFQTHLLDGDLCKNILFPYFLSFLVFRHGVITNIDFTHVAASHTG